jgi:hypothetical protein
LDDFYNLFSLVEAETPAQTTEEHEENGADVDMASSKPVGPVFLVRIRMDPF